MTRSLVRPMLILLLAAGLRLADIVGTPPGLQHDEVANWLIDRGILAGQHAVYFPAAYGHEAGYHYLQAASVALIGDNALALRLPTAFVALLGLAVSYALVRRLFGERAALVNGALVAITLWPLFFSRFGIRAPSLPLVSGLSAWFFWRGLGWDPNDNGQVENPRAAGHARASLVWMAVAGGLAGLSLHTYLASRAVPLIYAAFVAYLALAHRSYLRRHWRGLALFFVLMAAVAMPLLLWLAAHPGAESRVAEADAPLEALLVGDPRPVLANGFKLAGSFGWRGDPLVRHNIPNRPVLDPLGALFLYVGLLLAVWRWKRPQYAFALVWLVVSLVPSLVTIDAPSSIRCINALVVFGSFAGLTVDEGLRRLGDGRLWRWPLAVWLVGSAAWTGRDYFLRWRNEAEVAFVWQTALRDAAAALDTDPSVNDVALGGWSPDTMDPPTMDLYLRRTDLQLRFFYPPEALIIPATGGVAVWPAVLPLDPALEVELAHWGIRVQPRGSLVWLSLPAPDPVEQYLARYDFGVSLVGYRLVDEPAGVGLLTEWMVEGPLSQPLRIFAHFVDSAGALAGQDDGLGASAAHWQAGDFVIQIHRVNLPSGDYAPRIGLYNPATGERWPSVTSDGPAEFVELPQVHLP